jgi:vitamin B12 transporter
MRHMLKAALAATTLLIAPAYAQESEQIVVTATRTETPAERLPLRIDVTDRADIEALGLSTLAEAIGSQAVQSGGPGQQTSLFLRGANSKHALALFDGIRLNDAAGPNAAYDFGQDLLGSAERVEVLRGPASTIYGSDALGGVVNLIPRRGGDGAFEPFFEIMGGSHETRRGLLGAAGTASGWEYGVSAETFATGGFDQTPERFDLHTGDPDGASIDTFTGALRHQAGRFAWDALMRYREAEAEYDTLSGGPGFDQRGDDPNLGNESEQTIWRFGGEFLPQTDVSLRLSGGQVLSDRAEHDGNFQTNAAESERMFADLTAHYGRSRGSLTGGLSFESNAIDTLPQFADPLSVEEDQSAAFLIGQFDVSESVVATGSVRIDDNENFGSHTTYALGAVATFAPVRLYASYATAFKAPSLSERFEQSFFNIGNPDLEPEEAQIWEVGGDWDITGTLRVGLSYYQSRLDQLINYDFGALQNINIDEAEIDGAEIYAEVRPSDWSSLRLAYAWTDARDGVTGVQLQRRPENAWTLDARVQPTDRLGVAVNWIYVGERTDVTYEDDGTFESSFGISEAYDVGAVSVTYDLDDRAQAFVRVENVTDQVYEQPNAYAGAPRGAYLGVRARF